jgi:hypothetical protein
MTFLVRLYTTFDYVKDSNVCKLDKPVQHAHLRMFRANLSTARGIPLFAGNRTQGWDLVEMCASIEHFTDLNE